METFLSYIPLDITLIVQNFDRFLYGVLITLNLTFLSLFLGTLLAIPLAVARASKHPIINPVAWTYTYISGYTIVGANLLNILRSWSV